MLYTIGYEQSNIADFLATLQLAGINAVADIRDRAQSRRVGFSKSSLSAALKSAGIEYVHFKQLGDPKEGRDAARRGDFAEFRRVFAQVMASEKATTALHELEEMLNGANVCLMCYERDEKTCHRKIVADDLMRRTEISVKHLGVVHGVSVGATVRRVHDTYQGATTPL